MSPLTRAEAEIRARLLTVHHYAIDLDLTGGDETFRSTTRVTFSAAEPGAGTFVQVKPAALRRVVLNGRELDPAALDGNRLPLTGLAADNELLVEADMRYSRTGEGAHRFTDPADGETYVYSQCFLEDTQRIFACFDQPDLKAVFDLTVTVPPGWTALGNGIAHRDPDHEGRFTFATTPPLSTYLIAFAAGPYHSVHTEHAGLPLGLHCRRSLAEHLDRDAEELFDITRRSYDHYARVFDEPYPFDSYDQAFVPEFNAGAMENPGLVTFRDEFVFRSAVTDAERQSRAMVVAHEMAHMWFGDLVTLRWWDDIWLNESFAEYMGFQVISEATRFTGSWTAFAVTRKSWGYDADQRPSTHPVAPCAEDVGDTASALGNFDGISYAKGASAIRQLVAWLGEKTFLAGVNDHITRHRFGNATLADFTDSLARAATDRDVRDWAERWLRTTGVDTLTAHVDETTDDGWRLRLERDGSRPHHLAVALHDRAADGTLVPRGTDGLDLPGDAVLAGSGPRPALVLPNAGDLTYAKVRLDPGSWTTVTESLSAVPDPLDRALLWTTARDLVRDAELPPAAYLDLVDAHLPAETDVSVVSGVLTFARTVLADTYLAPARRDDALDVIARAARRLLETAGDPGLRLAALRSLITSATPGERAAELDDWLRTGQAPGGLVLDPELRWRALARLSTLGLADETRIAAELDRDPSSTGHESAATCRAALPDEQAKRAAWHALFEDDTTTNNLTIALATGLWQPEQHALLGEFVPRWFDAAAASAARRGPAIAAALTRHGFPGHAAEPTVLATGRAHLDRDDLTPAFRRGLTDCLDDLARAIRVREAIPVREA
ncbi:aminopeptidase N [Streptantibioticus parmotrematis]|uniref:aminopeptidase N n=1 Tax=Streptantibioticus parmotrematis TaxID=2873249 RepID=UPI0033F2EF1D